MKMKIHDRRMKRNMGEVSILSLLN